MILPRLIVSNQMEEFTIYKGFKIVDMQLSSEEEANFWSEPVSTSIQCTLFEQAVRALMRLHECEAHQNLLWSHYVYQKLCLSHI